MEFIIAFLIGFFSYWILTRDDLIVKKNFECPSKENFVRMAENCPVGFKRLKKELKQYSLLRIRDGHYEYQDVLQTLLKKEKK